MEVNDEITGYFDTAVAHYHLHPEIQISLIGNIAHLLLPSGEKVSIKVENGSPRLGESSWHPAFGVSVQATSLLIDDVGNGMQISIDWGKGHDVGGS